MRLIDADNIRDLLDAEFKETRKLILGGETHLDNLAEGFVEADRVVWAMPAVDAVPVVRCKDCKWFADNNDGDWFGCWLFQAIQIIPGDTPKPDDYCSYGERKDYD